MTYEIIEQTENEITIKFDDETTISFEQKDGIVKWERDGEKYWFETETNWSSHPGWSKSKMFEYADSNFYDVMYSF